MMLSINADDSMMYLGGISSSYQESDFTFHQIVDEEWYVIGIAGVAIEGGESWDLKN